MSDTATIAQQQRDLWNSPATRRWATEQARIDRVFTHFTEAALNAAAAKPGESVLDIGCGTGSTLLRLAETVGPTGSALGVDISAQQLEVARARIAAAGLAHATVTLADAAAHDFPPASIDLAFTRFGVMFFADPVAAFVNIRRAIKPRGRLAFAVFRTAAENPWAVAALTALAHLVAPQPPPGPEEPGQFGWADPARIRRILGGAGFQNIALTPFDVAVPLGPDAAEATTVATTLGQTGRLLQDLPETTRAEAGAALHGFFDARQTPTGINLPGALWLVSATN